MAWDFTQNSGRQAGGVEENKFCILRLSRNIIFL
jgi:hypothetical protein